MPFLNDLADSNINNNALSPLKHDYEGRFSRHGTKIFIPKKDPQWLDTLLVILFIVFLYSANLLLFSGSGSLKVFNNPFFPRAEVSLLILFISLPVSLLIILFHPYRLLKHGIASFSVLLFVYITYQQFSQYHDKIVIGSYVLPIYIVLGLILAVITFLIFQQKKVLYRILYVIAAFICFLHTYVGMITQQNTQEFVVSTNSMQLQNNVPDKRFIFFMFPNFASYAYLSTLPDQKAEETKYLLNGFLQKRNFTIFNNAYTPEKKYFSNMICNLNPFSNNSSKEHIMPSKILQTYWKFHNLQNEFINLKNNELYDFFHKQGYEISAYKSRDFDMCRKNHAVDVERCIEKVNHPINLYDANMSVLAKTGILAVEWLSSMNLFTNLVSLYNFISSYVNADKIPMIGTDYHNLYVVNSLKTFDVLFENIRSDKGKQAYFVFVDLPSNMYVYDEYCRLNSQDKWINMTGMPWLKTDYQGQRRDAYLHQTKCLIAKMEQFMQKMEINNKLTDSIIVVEGTSSVNDFQNIQKQNIMDDFVSNHLVTMAIFSGNNAGYQYNDTFCSTDKILADYLQSSDKCNLNRLNMHENIIQNINNKNNILNRNIKDNKTQYFADWFEQWEQTNSIEKTSKKDGIIKE